MKAKHLLYILTIVFILLLYNSFCYAFLNHVINERTKDVILDYLSINEDKYEFKKALYNENNELNVFIKTNYKDKKSEYYRFIFDVTGNRYNLIEVNGDIPAYIR